MREMRLSIGSSGWEAAKYLDGRPDAETVDLFGTHVLPTAFTALARYEDVRAALQRLNPSVRVTKGV